MAGLRQALESLALGPPAPSAPLENGEQAVSPTLGTSAFDVPPVALPMAPAAPVAAAPSVSWLRALAALLGRQPARMAAGVALVGLVVALSILASRGHSSRPAGRTPPRAAAALPPPVPVAPPVQPDPPPAPIAPAQAAASPEESAPERDCRISIGSRPWSEVWIDGRSTGRHTPLLNYKIACGRRTLTLKNAELALARSVVVTLKPRSRLRKVIRLGGPNAVQEPSAR